MWLNIRFETIEYQVDQLAGCQSILYVSLLFFFSLRVLKIQLISVCMTTLCFCSLMLFSLAVLSMVLKLCQCVTMSELLVGGEERGPEPRSPYAALLSAEDDPEIKVIKHIHNNNYCEISI